ncbi:hypothetical protein [Beijerinckia sp. L45]|uniref:COG3904 family protein n=1 Tax=Beijerinckia sp. L45 TaxID=1641855 RepID=UPI00131B3FE0|nr:hypothetical protein [Beijerinckia sp. L45]
MRYRVTAPSLGTLRRRALSLARSAAALVVVMAAMGVMSETARADEEMTFQAATIHDKHCTRGRACPSVIAASGRITERTPQMFLDFLEQHGGRNLHAVVFLDSPGGGVMASMEFGALLRQVGAAAVVARVMVDSRGEPVIVNAQCFSACVYALIGARKRVIPRESEVGIHRMFLSVDGIDPATEEALRAQRGDNSDMQAFLSRYTSKMGVSPALIARAEHTPSQSLYILSRADIRRWHLGVPNL